MVGGALAKIIFEAFSSVNDSMIFHVSVIRNLFQIICPELFQFIFLPSLINQLYVIVVFKIKERFQKVYVER